MLNALFFYKIKVPFQKLKNMSNKQFGVWMSEHKAVIVVKENNEVSIVAHEKSEAGDRNSSEKNANNDERTHTKKFFKEITSHLTNVTNVHITGTGTAQEQFVNYLKDIPQFKNMATEISSSDKMNDAEILEFMANKL